MMLRLGSLFAGIGGFDLGFHRADIRPVWAVEIEPSCQRVLRHHFPGLHIESDVREVGTHNLEPVDIITFGSPCQDLSVAGKRKGFDGERSGLYFEAIRVIRELSPAIAVWENVPGALSSHSGRDFGRALDELADIGALDIAWAVLDAQWFGVAQRRRRVFVVADFRGERAGEILALADGLSGHPAPRRATTEDIAGPLSMGASSGGGFRQDLDGTTYVPFDMTQVTSVANRQRLEAGREAPSLHAAGGAHVIQAYQCHGTNVGEMGTLRQGNGAVTGGVPFVTQAVPILEATGRQNENDRNDSGLGVGSDGDPMFTLQAGKQHAIAFTNRGMETGTSAETLRAGSHGALPMVAATLTSNGDAHSGHRDEHGLIPHSIARTLTQHYGKNPDNSESAPNVVISQMAVRRLTPTECEALQGFPRNWTAVDGAADSTRYRQLGNAVAVPVAEWIGRRIAASVESVTSVDPWAIAFEERQRWKAQSWTEGDEEAAE